MKTKFEEQVFCSSDEARVFIRNRITERKLTAKSQITQNRDGGQLDQVSVGVNGQASVLTGTQTAVKTDIQADLRVRTGNGVDDATLDSILRDEKLETLSDDELVLSIFFSEEIPDVRIAKEACLQCPVMDTCLKNAVKNREAYGVWGGQFFKDGAIDQPKRRGRPPKVVRPEFQVLEVPISKNVRSFIDAQKESQQAA